MGYAKPGELMNENGIWNLTEKFRGMFRFLFLALWIKSGQFECQGRSAVGLDHHMHEHKIF